MTFKFTSTAPTVVSNFSVHRRHFSVQVETDSQLHLLLEGEGTVGVDNYTVKLRQYDYWECPIEYKGRISAVFVGGSGVARITQHD